MPAQAHHPYVHFAATADRGRIPATGSIEERTAAIHQLRLQVEG
jgi:hypothetical protein